MFDLVDMIGLLAMCNKSQFLRGIGVLLINENGKLKRLLVRKEKYKQSVSDLEYFQRESIKDGILQKLSLFMPLTDSPSSSTLFTLRQ